MRKTIKEGASEAEVKQNERAQQRKRPHTAAGLRANNMSQPTHKEAICDSWKFFGVKIPGFPRGRVRLFETGVT